jgi:ATP-binding cassette subfamily B protein/subfamily B ATP-binding cassette protein MsbA
MKRDLHYEEQQIEKSFDLAIFKRLASFTKPYIKLLILSGILLLFVTAVDLIRPYLIKIVIDDHISGYETEWVVLSSPPEGVTEFAAFQGQYYARAENLPGPTAAPSAQLLRSSGTYYLLEGYVPPQDIDDFSAAIRQRGGVPLSAEDAEAFVAQDKAAIVRLSWIFLMMLAGALVISYLQTLLLNHVGQRLVFDMRAHLYDHLLNQPLAFYDRNPVGRLVTRVTSDMKNISEMYTDVLIHLVNDLLLLTGTLVIMMTLNWRLALISLSTVPLVILASYGFRLKARQAHRAVKVRIARINATLGENLSGMRVIQQFRKEKEIMTEFETINRDHLEASMSEVKVFGVFRPSMNLLYTIALSLLIWYSGGRVLRGAIELGTLIAFVSYTEQFFRPIFDLSEKFNILQSAMASSERIFLLLEEDDRLPDGSRQVTESEFQGRVSFENVSFSYHPEEPVLKNVTFEVPPGETLAIVGATGSGKTTIISLLSRLYDVTEGRITVDGVDIRSLDKASLRRQIGVVLQDVFLFSGDILDNITLGDPDITEAQAIAAARFVNADKFISHLPDQYRERVYERGATLSTGQRQLLSFARALAYNPGILILDEATSSIDTETEQLIQDAIRKLTRGRTTIVIAHRLSTIQHADRIMVLHEGEIREMGTHEDLLNQGGLYYDLYRLQYQS